MKLDIVQMQRIETEMLREAVRILSSHKITFYFCYGSALGAVRHQGAIPWDCDADLAIPVNELSSAIEALRSELSDVFRIDDINSTPQYFCIFPRIGLAHSSSYFLHVDLFPMIGLPNDREKQEQISKTFDKYQSIFSNKCFRQRIGPNFIKKTIGLLIELIYFPYSRKRLWKKIYTDALNYPYESAKYVMPLGGHYGVKRILEKEVFGTPVWCEYEGIKVPVPEYVDRYLKYYYSDYLSFPPKEVREKLTRIVCEIDDQDYVNFEKYLSRIDI